jgi:hypothetical protein
MQSDIFTRYAPENAADAGRYPLNRNPNLVVLVETNIYLQIVFFTSNWEFNEIDLHLNSPPKSTNCFAL